MNPQESDPIPDSPSTPDPAANGAARPAPDNVPPAAAELIDDIEAYQRRIESEWEKAKNVYQSRISEIMDDFLKKGAAEPAANGRATPSKGPAQEPDSVESIVARVASELRALDARNRRAAGAPARPMLPGPAPRSPWYRRAALMALAAIVGGAAYAALRMPEWTPLPYARTGGIAVTDGKIYVADWFRKTLYVHVPKRGAPITSVETLPVGLVAGLQPDARGIWTVDALSREILRHAPTPDHQVLHRYAAPDARPAAITRDGDDLWLAGLESNSLFRLRADDPTEAKDRYDLPLSNVTALQVRDNRLWALDGKSREITVFRLQKPLKVLATIDLDPFLRGATPTGLSMNGDRAWIVTENPSAIVRVPVSKLKKSKSSEF